ncbi:ribose-phosphate diphosphokinase [Patescibacteria group bacterium]|nr:ribose-phosphate diphosphokinase [Patescibacteria group bacterium]MBU1705333.1 ribose-phosphate diphosphokinase [Patescibacteria group bacterium]
MYFLTDSANHLRRLMINRGASIGSAQQSISANGERSYRLKEDLKREQIRLVASIWPDANSLFDLLAYFRLLRDHKCPTPSLVIPYLAYAREYDEPGQAKINEMLAELVRNLNPAKISVFDLHDPRLLANLGANARIVNTWPLLAERLLKDDAPEVVLAPDEAAKPLAQALINLLGGTAELAYIEKERPKPNSALANNLVGEVSNRRVLIADDIIDTGATMIEAVRLVSQKGASQIRLAANHGIFTQDAREKLSRLPIQDIYVTNTWPQPRHPIIKTVDISSLLITLP